MASTVVLSGLALGVFGFGGRALVQHSKTIAAKLPKVFNFSSAKYYKGGFDKTMSRREASLILGVPQSAAKKQLKKAHMRVMLLNHPDRGM